MRAIVRVMARGLNPRRPVAASKEPLEGLWDALRRELVAHGTTAERQRVASDRVPEMIGAMTWAQACALAADVEFHLKPGEADGVALYEDDEGGAWDEDAEVWAATGIERRLSLEELVDEVLAEEGLGGCGDWASRCAALARLDAGAITVQEAAWDYSFEHGSSYSAAPVSLDRLLRRTIEGAVGAFLERRIENDPMLSALDWSDPLSVTARGPA